MGIAPTNEVTVMEKSTCDAHTNEGDCYGDRGYCFWHPRQKKCYDWGACGANSNKSSCEEMCCNWGEFCTSCGHDQGYCQGDYVWGCQYSMENSCCCTVPQRGCSPGTLKASLVV